MGKPVIPPYGLQILTTEYLIVGTVPGDTSLDFFEQDSLLSPIQLQSAQVFPTRSNLSPSRNFPNYFVRKFAAIAYIPLVDFSQNPQNSEWNHYKTPVNGVFHLGPYCLTGRMMTNSGAIHGRLPVFDIKITSQVPGTNWSGIYAPFALIRGSMIHGWEPQ